MSGVADAAELADVELCVLLTTLPPPLLPPEATLAFEGYITLLMGKTREERSLLVKRLLAVDPSTETLGEVTASTLPSSADSTSGMSTLLGIEMYDGRCDARGMSDGRAEDFCRREGEDGVEEEAKAGAEVKRDGEDIGDIAEGEEGPAGEEKACAELTRGGEETEGALPVRVNGNVLDGRRSTGATPASAFAVVPESAGLAVVGGEECGGGGGGGAVEGGGEEDEGSDGEEDMLRVCSTGLLTSCRVLEVDRGVDAMYGGRWGER